MPFFLTQTAVAIHPGGPGFFRPATWWLAGFGLRGEEGTGRSGRERALRQGEDGLCLHRHVLLTRAQTAQRRRLPEETPAPRQ